MRIKALRPPQRQGAKLHIDFDDGTELKVVPSVAADLGLYPGMELDEADMERLRAAAGLASAKSRAVRIISASGVSREDLTRRLVQKGERPEDARAAAQWLTDLDLLDDAETARQIVRRGLSRGYCEARIRQMLYEKRIPKQYWEPALAELPDLSDALTDFLAKRLGPDPDEKQRRSAVNAAIRRGYSWSQIQQALSRLAQEPEWEE